MCQKQLFECFRQLKHMLVSYSVFNDTVLAYLDFQHMRELVEDAKRHNRSNGVMSLKVAFNTNPYGFSPETVSTGNYLVSVLERLGPTDCALVPLNPTQVKFLNELATTPSKQLYWPNGTEGISWFTQLS